MASKDWREGESPIEGNFLFINQQDNSRRIVLFRNYPKHDYDFMIYQNNTHRKKNFSSRDKALSYAKKYMQSH